jgi:hypothetical protein
MNVTIYISKALKHRNMPFAADDAAKGHITGI